MNEEPAKTEVPYLGGESVLPSGKPNWVILQNELDDLLQ